MTHRDEVLLARMAAGGATAGELEELERRATADPAVAARLAAWRALELPPPAAAPPGFSGRVLARLRSGAATPAAARFPGRFAAPLAASLLLAAGVVLGAGVGFAVSPEASDEGAAWEEDDSLATAYLSAADEALTDLGAEP
jgi:hypothetical protein